MAKWNHNKWISIILAVAMLCPCLISCGKEANEFIENNSGNDHQENADSVGPDGSEDENEDQSVAEYEELMTNLDTFPLTFHYDGTKYSGFAGFSEESRKEEALDNGKKITVFLRHPEINASFELVTNVYPKENAYECDQF